MSFNNNKNNNNNNNNNNNMFSLSNSNRSTTSGQAFTAADARIKEKDLKQSREKGLAAFGLKFDDTGKTNASK
jgi:hypothetical protein